MNDRSLERALVERLSADGPADDAALARALSVTPDRIAHAARALADKGMDIGKQAGGQRILEAPVSLLEYDDIVGTLDDRQLDQLDALELLWQTGSTSSDLMAQAPPPPGKLRVRLAEFQDAGRGRRGKHWRAPPGSSLLMSLAWTFSDSSTPTAGLSIAAGSAVREVLVAQGIQDLRLKWPNDLVARERKLGGVLAELRHDARGLPSVVIGIGVNYRLSQAACGEIARLGGLPCVDIVELAGDHAPRRSALAGRLIGGLLDMLIRFECEGLAPFVAAWRAADACHDRSVTVTTPHSVMHGVARGIDESGALRLEVDGCEKQIVSAEVSLRTA